MRVIVKEQEFVYNLFGERGTVVSAEGLPYIGNKGRMFEWILRTIEKDRGIGTKVGIPFCGGGADSIGFARNGYMVKANDLNIGVVELLERVTKGDKEALEFAKHFISRAEFLELKDKDTWQGAFARAYYSFRSTGQTYAFGKDTELEASHKALWQAIVHRGEESINQWNKVARIKGYQAVEGTVPTRTWQENNFGTTSMIFYALEIDKFKLEEENIEWHKKDYADVDWEDCEFLYVDKPYSNTGGVEYRETIGKVAGFDHSRFWQWAKEQAKTKDVFVSEKAIPKDIEVKILAKQEKSVSLGKHKGVTERIEYLLKVI